MPRPCAASLLVATAALSPALSTDVIACDGTSVVWSQPAGAEGGITSQDDACYPFLSESADDFTSNGEAVTHVEWWGAFFNGEARTPDGFRIVFYDAGRRCPESVLYAFETTAFDEREVGEALYRYCTAVPEPIVLPAGDTFHLSIVASLCAPPEWGWASAVNDGTHACFRSVILQHPSWEPVISNRAFVLRGAPTPTGESSWTRVKARYRASGQPVR